MFTNLVSTKRSTEKRIWWRIKTAYIICVTYWQLLWMVQCIVFGSVIFSTTLRAMLHSMLWHFVCYACVFVKRTLAKWIKKYKRIVSEFRNIARVAINNNFREDISLSFALFGVLNIYVCAVVLSSPQHKTNISLMCNHVHIQYECMCVCMRTRSHTFRVMLSSIELSNHGPLDEWMSIRT